MEDDNYVTQRELNTCIKIYDGKIKQHILTTQTELKSDFISYVNDIVKNNKENIGVITNNISSVMTKMGDKIDGVSKDLNVFKSMLIIALVVDILSRVIF